MLSAMPFTCFTFCPNTPSSAEPTCCSTLPMIIMVPPRSPLPVSERTIAAWLSPAPVRSRLSESGPFNWLPAMPPPSKLADLDLVDRDLGRDLRRRAGIDRGSGEVEGAAIDIAGQGADVEDTVLDGELGHDVVDALVGHDQRVRLEIDIGVLALQGREVERFIGPGRAAALGRRRGCCGLAAAGAMNGTRLTVPPTRLALIIGLGPVAS